jgi:hypothetical protein
MAAAIPMAKNAEELRFMVWVTPSPPFSFGCGGFWSNH